MTESDRELLELAAKAANVRFEKSRHGFVLQHFICKERRAGSIWNPLTDDGDALRLAMKLRISPSFRGYATEGQGFAEASYSNPRNSRTTVQERVQVAYIPEEMFQDHRHSKFAAYMMEEYADELVRGFEAATRRAIVRAAAEIARATHKEGA